MADPNNIANEIDESAEELERIQRRCEEIKKEEEDKDEMTNRMPLSEQSLTTNFGISALCGGATGMLVKHATR